MRRIEKSYNFTAKDLFNVMSAKVLGKSVGETITVIGVALGKDVSHDTGEEVNTAYLKCDNGTIYSTISSTAITAVDALVDVFADEEGAPQKVYIDSRKSNAGRDFIVLVMV